MIRASLKAWMLLVIGAVLLTVGLPAASVTAQDSCTLAAESVEAVTQMTLSPDYQWYVRMGEQATAGGVLEVRNSQSNTCVHYVIKAQAGNGWYRAEPLGTIPTADFFTGALIWNNVGSVPIDQVVLVAPGLNCSPNAAGQCQRQDGQRRTMYWPVSAGQDGDLVAVSTVPAPVDKGTREVVTYIDHKIAYIKPKLTSVDTRYMRAGTHEVEVHITYNDGTKVVYTETVTNGSEDITTYYYVYIAPNLKAAGAIGIVAVTAVGLLVLLALIRAWYRRHLWLKEHNLLHH